jgi:hypothetical protein
LGRDIKIPEIEYDAGRLWRPASYSISGDLLRRDETFSITMWSNRTVKKYPSSFLNFQLRYKEILEKNDQELWNQS